MKFPAVQLALWLFLIAATPAWAQTNDNFAGRLALSGSAATAVSNNLRATREPGEPNHAGVAGGRSLWWTWTAPASGVVNFSTFGGGAAPSRAGTNAAARSLAVYTGNSLAALSEVASATTLNLDPYYLSQRNGVPAGPSLSLPVTAGTAYQIAVDGPAALDPADDGTVVLSINQAPAIYSAAGAAGTVGASFFYTIQASNNPTSFDAADLPPGLSVNPYTGDITGTPQAAGAFSLRLSAVNPGGTGTGTLTLAVGAAAAVAASPAAPVIYSSAAASGTVGAAFSYSLAASDNPATFGVANLPSGLSFDASSGLISGTPAAAGVFDVPVTAVNAAGTGHAAISINIAAGPHAPVIASSLAAGGTVGTSFSYTVYTNDNSDAAKPSSYSASNLPPGLGIDAKIGSIQGTPTAAGVYAVPVTAVNAAGAGSAVLTITVAATAAPAPQAAPPLLDSSAVAASVVGTAFTYRLTATNAPTGFTAANLPPGLGVNPQTGYIAGTPSNTGVFAVPVTAVNAYGNCQGTLTLTVTASKTAAPQSSSSAANPPVITSPAAARGYVGQGLSYQIAPAYDNFGYYSSSGASVIYRASNLPPGLTLNLASGLVSGTPTAAGSYAAPVSISVPYTTSSSTGASSIQYATGTAVVTFVVGASAPPVSAAPVITSAAASSTAVTGSAFSGYALSASNSPTGYTADNLPPGLTLNPASGAISGTPTAAGTYVASVAASNAAGTGDAKVTFTVAASAAALAAPTIFSSATASGTVGSSFSYFLSASPSITSYAAGSLPPGLSVDAASGYISGTPTAAGVYLVPISAANASGTASATLTITVATGQAPVIASYATVHDVVGSTLSLYALSASNSPTGYTVSNLPPGLSTDSSNYISGTPTAAGVYPVTINATNSAGTSSATVIFSIDATLSAPVLAGSAVASGTVGVAFTYYPNVISAATDCTASNLPPGLIYNSPSGAITGTPTTAGVYAVPMTLSNAGGATYATVTITVADAPAAPAAPVFTSAAAASGIVGTPFSYTLAATDSPKSFDRGAGLPPGLSLNPSTGVISGTPTAGGVYNVSIYASNGAGSGQAKLTLQIAAGPSAAPTITSAAGAATYTTDPFSYAITATNAPTSYTATNLPAGLTLNPLTGIISGSVTSSVTSTVAVALTAANAIGRGSAILTLRFIAGAGQFTSPLSASGVKGTAFAYATAVNVSASRFLASSLPPGLFIDYYNGQITGTPTASGTYYATLSASQSGGSTFSASVTFVIGEGAVPAQPVLSSNAGAHGVTGEPFAYTLTAANGPASLTAASLPAGLSFNAATGLISGTLTTTGDYFITLVAANSSGTTRGTLRLYVTGKIAKFIHSAGAEAIVGKPFNFQLVDNAPSSSFYNQRTSLPPGLSLNTGSGIITGTPARAGVFNVSFSTYTSLGDVDGSLSIAVGAASTAPTLVTSAAEAEGAVGAAFDYTLAASNGPTSFSAANLPIGLEYDPATGKFFGRPTKAGVFYVPVTATNPINTSAATLTFLISDVPRPPRLDATRLTASATVGTATVLSFIQATNSPTSYTASGLPPGLSLDPASGTISGTPASEGLFPVTVSAANGGGSAGAVVTLLVGHGSAPQFYREPVMYAGRVGVSFSHSSSTLNSPRTYASSGLPSGLYLDAGTGRIYGVPVAPGAYPVTLTASNAAGSDSETIILVISGSPTPTFSSVNAAETGRVGSSFSSYFYPSDATACTVSGLPPGLSYSFSYGYSGLIRGMPTAAGIYPATITATSAAGASSAVVTFTIAEASTLAAPVINGAAGAVGYADAAFGYAISASSSPAGYTASGLPDGLRLDPASGYVSGTPTTAGNYPVSVSAANAGGTGSAVVTLRIEGALPTATAPPVINSPATAYFSGGASGSYYSYYPYFSQTFFNYAIAADGNPTSFGASDLPPGLSINPYTGIISGRPLTAGTFTATLSAANAVGASTAVLTIIAASAAPTLAPALTVGGVLGSPFGYPIRDAADSPFNYYPFTNTPRETPVYAAAGLPPGLSLNPGGYITGTPTQAGSFPAVLSATNRAGAGSAVLTFVIAAAPPPASVPAALYGAATALGFVGSPFSYGFSAANTPTSYSASGLPAGLNINPLTGNISGTPTTVGTYAVLVSAANAAGAANATLTIAVSAASPAPVISSSAGARATVGTAFNYSIFTAYSAYTPTAASYGADGLPDGLSLNASNGQITGVPTAAGEYSIPISAGSPSAVGRATLTLTVLPAPATLATLAAPVSAGLAGTVGFTQNPFVHDLGAGGFAPDGALPRGLAYDAATGIISGYPAVVGDFDVPLSAANAGGAGHAVLHLRLVTPDLSLPRIIVQPVGQTVAQGGAAVLSAAAVGVPTPDYQWLHDGAATPSENGSELDFATARPADAGTYVLVAGNSSGSAASTGAVLRVVQTYAGWQSAYFNPQEIAAGLAADNYDFNGDGLPNLLEYALGRNPRAGGGGGVPATSKPAGGPLQIQFSRDGGKTDLGYLVEISPDLWVWTAIARSTAGGATSNLGGASAVTENAAGGGLVTVTVQDGQVATVGGSQFIRLRVTRP